MFAVEFLYLNEIKKYCRDVYVIEKEFDRNENAVENCLSL